MWPSDGALWIVEGGTDALAVMDWYRPHRVAAPSIVVSGGAGVRAFLDQPHVQGLLRKSATVYLSLENEKDQETQIKTDAAHQRQAEKSRFWDVRSFCGGPLSAQKMLPKHGRREFCQIYIIPWHTCGKKAKTQMPQQRRRSWEFCLPSSRVAICVRHSTSSESLIGNKAA